MPFEDLLGNPRIKKIFKNYLRNDTIPFSMIFSGPPSSLIMDFALAFAKALNCADNGDDLCGVCENCRDIEREVFPDVVRLAPDGQYYKKDQITYLIEENYKRPLRGNKKVYILRDVHRLTENAANAFLKVLEEPAPSSIFILLTQNVIGLLPTIKSRCQILNFSSPSRREILDFLIKNGQPRERAQLISHLSQGTSRPLGVDNLDVYLDKRANAVSVLVKLLTKEDVEDVLLDLYHRSRSREKFLNYFRELIHLISSLLRDIMILQVHRDSEHLIHVDFRDTLMALCEVITIEKTLFLIQRMEWLFRDIMRNLNTRVLILEFIRNFTQKEVNDV